MQVALIALALAGCNQVYSLDATHLPDAPPPDAPFRCTDAAPVFTGVPVPVIVDQLVPRWYSISLDRSLAVALVGGTLFEAPADSPMTKASLMMPPPAGSIASVRMSPEGDELFVSYQSIATGDRYTRAGDRWANPVALAMTGSNSAELSAPTRRSAGPRHILVRENITTLVELAELAPDQWMRVATYTAAELGGTQMYAPSLTTDGLHLTASLITTKGNSVAYASRTMPAERFGPASNANPFFGAPFLFDPFLVEDCSRLYFMVAQPNGVFYIEP